MDSGLAELIDELELRIMALEEKNRDLERVNQGLEQKNAELKARKDELNLKLMNTKALLSDAGDTVKRWRTELEIVASKEGHNLCHIWIPDLLKRTLGHTGNFPDPDGMTEEEFRQGCEEYRTCIFAAIRAKQAEDPKLP